MSKIKESRPARKRKTKIQIRVCKYIDDLCLYLSIILVSIEFCSLIIGAEQWADVALYSYFAVLVVWFATMLKKADLVCDLKAMCRAERREK